MSERARPPDDIDPADFFTRWVPAAVHNDPERRGSLGGTEATIQFELEGDGGGTFTVEIREGRVEGHAHGTPEPDLRVRVDVATWRALNRGDVSAPEAMLRRRVHLRGNLLLAIKLHMILG